MMQTTSDIILVHHFFEIRRPHAARPGASKKVVVCPTCAKKPSYVCNGLVISKCSNYLHSIFD